MDKNRYLIDLSESEHTDFGRVDFSRQSDVQKVFSAIWELESQVNNGGFDQYFRNTDYELIAHTATALRAIGAASCAAIVDSAIQVISPMPVDNDARCDALDSAEDDAQDRLNALDTQFFAYPDNLTDLLFAYVSRNAGLFGEVSR
jgi:hypothetical protein